MVHRWGVPERERRLLSRVRQLLGQPGLLHGSLRVNRRRCGKRGCRCTKGQLHAGVLLAVMQRGRQVSLYVPAAWEGRVRQWVGRDREIRKLLVELSGLYTERLRRRKE